MPRFRPEPTSTRAAAGRKNFVDSIRTGDSIGAMSDAASVVDKFEGDSYTPSFPARAATAKAPKVFTKILSGTSEQTLTDMKVTAESIQFIGEKSIGVVNTGTVTIMLKDENGDFQDAKQLPAGGVLNWPAPPGTRFNLSNFHVKGTAADGIRVLYA